MALDYGTVRTGIAVTDELQMIASGLTTVATKSLPTFLKSYLNDEKVVCIVVGEPKQMDGTLSESEVAILPFIQKLKKWYPDIKIARHDERFTSKLAFQTMLDSGLGKKKRRDKALVDEISATIILQDYLNAK